MKSLIIAIAGVGLLSGSAAAGTWTGKASYYGVHGRTASGTSDGSLTAAHRSLPFGTRLRITNLSNQRSVIVRVNDRGPFVRGRIVDVSAPAANVLGMRSAGIATVRVETVID